MKQPLDLTKKNLKEIFHNFYTYGTREGMYDVIYDLDRIDPELFRGEGARSGAWARQALDYLVEEKDRMSTDEINGELHLIFVFLRLRRLELFPDWWDGGRRRRTRRGRKSRRKSRRSG
jgi:hypothetical protein